MEYVYCAMLLHKAGKEINETNLKKVLEAAGVKVDESRVKALVAALDGVNIDEEIEKASAMQVASVAVPVVAEKKEERKEEKKEEGKSAEEAAAGLGALFG